MQDIIMQGNLNGFETVRKMGNDPEKSGHMLQRYGKIYFNIFWYTSPKTGWLGLVPSYIRNKNCIVKDLHRSTCGLCLELFWKWSWKIWMVLKPSGKWEMIWKNPAGFETIRKVEIIWKNPDSLSGFSVLHSKISGRTKKIPGSNATLLPRFLHLCSTYLYFDFHLLAPQVL